MCSMMNHSSDDGARLLWLEFRGPGGEEELDMGKNPKVGQSRSGPDGLHFLTSGRVRVG